MTPATCQAPARDHGTGHCASQNSHNHLLTQQHGRPRPARQSLCEPILTQTPLTTGNQRISVDLTATMRANPHTMTPNATRWKESEHTNRHRVSQSSQSHGSSLSKVAGTTATTPAAQHLSNHVCLAIHGTADLPIELEYQLASGVLRVP